MAHYALAVDIGGTFTDAVLRSADGRTWVDKTLTTPESLDVGFFRAVDDVLRKADIASADVTDVVVHATTVVTNAVIERKGPRTALLVTEGFRDILTIRDEHRYEMFDPQIEFPQPLVPRELTFGVSERRIATGEVVAPLDVAQAQEIVAELARKDVAAVAVSFLNAYLNPANEQAMREIIRARAPAMHVSISSDVAPQIREYPRTSTVAMNAYTMPITGPYLEALRRGLKERGFPNDPLIMLSNGGVIGIDVASRYPVRMVESGRRRARWRLRITPRCSGSTGSSRSTWAAPPPRPASSRTVRRWWSAISRSTASIVSRPAAACRFSSRPST